LNDEKTLKWLRKADNDLKAAEHIFLYFKEELITEIICFHCQQAVEKFLKGFLSSCEINFPKTHDLFYLRLLCTEQERSFADIDVSGLALYAVETRYPEEFYTPTKQEAEEALLKAKEIKKFVLNKLKRSETDLTLF
jgi:HEPN domain-containing protein